MKKRLAIWFMVMFALANSVGGLFTAQPVRAAGKPLDLEMSPLPINLVTDPGKTVTTELRIKQAGPNTEKLKVSLMKFGAFGDSGKPQILERGPGDDYFDWVKFDRPTFEAPANVWQTVKMTINVPKTAAFGYYYAVVFTRVGDDARKDGNTSSIAGGTAILVLLEARVPNAKRQMELLSLTSKHRVYEFLPADFEVKFRNTGNVHVVPHGDIFIMSGKKSVATLPINGAQGNLLPASNRIFPVTWLDGFPHIEKVLDGDKAKLDKKGRPMFHLVWNNGGLEGGTAGNAGSFQAPHVRFGKYTAHLFAVYDNGGRDVPVESTLDFWVIPWRFLLVLLLVLGLAGFGIYAAVRGAFRGAKRIGRRR
jgi:hypothetical protein